MDREDCSKSLAKFVKEAWHVLEPGTPLAWGWALDAMCDHLEAVTNGDIRRLLINIPPGLMKSLLVSVFWPAWEWGPKGMGHLRYVSTSHAQDLANRDSRKMRLVVNSDWYQERWPVQLAGDANAVTFFENDKRGFRSSTAFTSMTGKRGDRVILDDPHSVKSGESDVQRAETIRTFREALPSRVNGKQSAIVIVMQRLHEDDVSGNIIGRETEYVHLCLPMRYEPERQCKTVIGFSDPRKEDGDLLFPELFDEERTRELEGELGSYGVSGQLQQRPVPRGGGMFKYDWFDGKIISASEVPHGCEWVRGWDFAGSTEKGADATAGVKIGRAPDGRFIIADVRHDRLESPGVKRLVRRTAEMDGKEVTVDIPQDPGSAGKSVRLEYVSHLAGFKVKWGSETGDKADRAQPFQTQCENGNVYLVQGDWNQGYLDELCTFPAGKHDDRVDATSRAFNRLTTMKPSGLKIVTPKVVTT